MARPITSRGNPGGLGAGRVGGSILGGFLMSYGWKWGNKYRYRFSGGWLDIVRLKDSVSVCVDGESADMFCDDALHFQNARQLDRACERFFPTDRFGVREAEQAGYWVIRGSYHGTTDDRIDRWYIVQWPGLTQE